MRTMNTFNSKQELEEHLRQEKRALILFCASWCPFCQDFFPNFERTVKKSAFDMVMRVYMDDYSNPLWEEFSIEAVPTAALFENGKATKRLDARLGFGLSEKAFGAWLNKL